MADLKKIAEEISKLTLIEAVELKKKVAPPAVEYEFEPPETLFEVIEPPV